ncbi:MAG: Fic family protein [Alphaproteobacteria bacterium]|nr:Fic family protein [Alphaproteobacteria bacterium]
MKNIAAQKKRLDVLLKNKDNHTVLNRWLKTELTYTSNAIEGNTLTRKETTLAIEENITSGSKPINDYLEARNHAAAYDFVVELAVKKDKVDEDVILQIHKLILSGIDDLNAGSYRPVRVRLVGSNTILPNPAKVPELMKEFDRWLTTTKEDAVDKAIEAHYRLVTIHPFVDGNGRTARLLMNLILMLAGYCPIIIRKIDRKRYLSALEERQTKDNAVPYVSFMRSALNRSLKTVIDALDTDKGTETQKLLTISKFAKLVGVPTSTIRYWVQVGKVTPAAYLDSGYMMFDPKQKNDLK